MDASTATSAATTAYGAWASLAVVGALAIAVVGGALLTVRLVTRVVDRIHDSAARLSTYECGEAPVGDGREYAWPAFAEIAAFAGILALGLVWVARMGGFVWDRTVEDEPSKPAGGGQRG